MAINIRKQERETNLSLVRRFTKRMKESGVLRETKKRMFTKRKPSKTKKKVAALRKIEKKREYDKLAKMGKL